MAVPPPPVPGGGPSGVSTLLVVGDDSGARAELVVSYSYRHDVVQVGEAAELLVLSTDRDFRRFKVGADTRLRGSTVAPTSNTHRHSRKPTFQRAVFGCPPTRTSPRTASWR